MGPSGLTLTLLCLYVGGATALLLPDEAVRPPFALHPSTYALHRLLGRKRALQVNWVPPGASEDLNWKRAPNGLGASGFYGDVFNQGFGAFSPVKRSRQFSKRRPRMTASRLQGDVLADGKGTFDMVKRRPEMSASGFYDDVFRGGMGHFDTMKRRPEMSANGFYDDVFRGGMGHFDTMKRVLGGKPSKNSLESSGIHVHLPSSQSATSEADESRDKRRSEDETMSAKGLRSELLSGSEEFSTMR